MRRAASGVAAVLVVLVAAGCAAPTLYKLASPGERSIGGAYTVEPGLAWTVIDSGNVETWTIEGVALERLRFFAGIAEGQAMPATTAADARFQPTMTLPEIAELVTDGLFGTLSHARNVRPARFGTAPGVRFEVAYATSDGVQREALVVGAVVQQRLHVVVYDGTALHHFDKYRAEAERIIASIRLAPR